MPTRMNSKRPLSDNLLYREKNEPVPLYKPSNDYVEGTNMFKFIKYIGGKYNVNLTYKDVHEWSINQRSLFWREIWTWCEIRYSKNFEQIVDETAKMVGPTEWFRGAHLNYAENIIERGNDEDVAIIQFGI